MFYGVRVRVTCKRLRFTAVPKRAQFISAQHFLKMYLAHVGDDEMDPH